MQTTIDAMVASEQRTEMLGMPEPAFLDAVGASFPLVKAGTGTPILFVHGAWADHRIWCGVWQQFASAYEFLAVTQRHFGCHNWSGEPQFARLIHTQDLIAIIKVLNKPMHLVGWSYAGAILLKTAGELPDLVRSVSIYEPSYESEAMPVEGDLRQARETFWQELEPAYDMAQSGEFENGMRLGCEVVFGLGRGDFETLAPQFQQVFLENVHTMLPDLEAPTAEPLTAAELAAVTCPALIIQGELTHDQYRIMADSTVASLPNSSASVFNGVGHGGPVQVPKRFAATVLDFVESVSS
jgi:pimeloyl-ACP methyl ester carboxylesterase